MFFSPEQASIFAGTVDTKFQSFSIKNRQTLEQTLQEYTINVIDTPGTFEVKAKDDNSPERTNEAITETIAKCLENEITNLNVIILFVTFEAGINPQDIESMKIFLNMFGTKSDDKSEDPKSNDTKSSDTKSNDGAKSEDVQFDDTKAGDTKSDEPKPNNSKPDDSTEGVKVALCITRADNHSEQWRTDIIGELKKHKEISNLLEKKHLDILFMGCADWKSGRYRRPDDIHDAYVDVYNLREIMLRYIFGAKNRVQLTRMNVARDKIAKMKGMLEQATKNFKYFNTVPDFGSSQGQLTLIEHVQIMKYIQENKAFVSISDLSHVFADFVGEAHLVAANDKIPQDEKKRILGDLEL